MPGQGSLRLCRRDAVGGSVARKRHRAQPRRWRGDAHLAVLCCLTDLALTKLYNVLEARRANDRLGRPLTALERDIHLIVAA